MADKRENISTTEIHFVSKTLPTEKRPGGGVPSAERTCSICLRPIWHLQRRGPYARNCGPVCMLTRRFLGGMRSPEATFDIMRAKNICSWKSLEEFWRDMGSTYFEGAFFVRRNRQIPHGPDNSSWVSYPEAKRIQTMMAQKNRDSKMTSTGVTIGDVATKFGCRTFLFQRICGAISKRYAVPIDVVYAEFASVPPPVANWAHEITVYHQGRDYTLQMISLDARVSTLALYYRWMKGMYVIDDELAFRIQQQRSRYSGKRKNKECTWGTGEFQ